MIRSKRIWFEYHGREVNENGSLENRIDKIAGGINAWCWWSMMLLDTRNL